LASPALTGTPTAPTQAALLNSTAIATTAYVDRTTREKLTANRTYYVRTDGSNSNTGLVNSAGGAFLTIQRAYDVIVANLDLAGFTVTVQIADGTYTGGLLISQPWIGGGAVIFQGNSVTPANVVISTTSADCFGATGSLPGTLTVKDCKVQTTTSGSGLNMQAVGLMQFGNMEFGACSSGQINCGASTAGSGANISCISNYKISGGAFAHVVASRVSNVAIESKTITITGTPAFSNSFALADLNSLIALDGNTFSGTATGPRYNVMRGGCIYTAVPGTLTYLPGNAVGTGTNAGVTPFGLYA
jgi:hypothetical protein